MLYNQQLRSPVFYLVINPKLPNLAPPMSVVLNNAHQMLPLMPEHNIHANISQLPVLIGDTSGRHTTLHGINLHR